MGISHLLEHMVFKGTERRTAQELALELEVRGGGLDAFTGRDYTSYQAHVLDADLPLAVEILTDLVAPSAPPARATSSPSAMWCSRRSTGWPTRPTISSSSCTPATLWPQHPYGYSILGTPETLAALSAEDLQVPASAAATTGATAWSPRRETWTTSQLLTVLEREGWFEGTVPEPPRGRRNADPGRAGRDAAPRSGTPRRPTSSSAPTPFRSAIRAAFRWPS